MTAGFRAKRRTPEAEAIVAKDLEMIYRTWQCNQLKLHLSNGNEVECAGTIICSSTGKIEIQVKIDKSYALECFAERQSIEGTTTNGMIVKCEGAFAISLNYDSDADLSIMKFAFTSCNLLHPAQASPSSARFHLKSLVAIGRSDFVHMGKHCRIFSVNNNDKTPGLIRAVMEMEWPTEPTDILIMLSLAQRCMISAPLQEMFSGSDLVAIQLFPNEEPYAATNPLIPWNGADTSTFLNQCLPAFVRLHRDYALDKLIGYYCLSVSHPYGEIKFILASVFMEAFKFHWALNVGMKTAVRKVSGIVKGFQKALNRKGDPVFYTFEELLYEACASIGYNTTFTFVEDRNAMFHSGIPGDLHGGPASSWNAIRPELTTLYRQIDDILLTILGYSGNIARWEAPDNTIRFP